MLTVQTSFEISALLLLKSKKNMNKFKEKFPKPVPEFNPGYINLHYFVDVLALCIPTYLYLYFTLIL